MCPGFCGVGAHHSMTWFRPGCSEPTRAVHRGGGLRALRAAEPVLLAPPDSTGAPELSSGHEACERVLVSDSAGSPMTCSRSPAAGLHLRDRCGRGEALAGALRALPETTCGPPPERRPSLLPHPCPRSGRRRRG